MDPFPSLLVPFIPLALLTATFVALVRRVFPKLDGKPVLAVVAGVAVGVVLWSQMRAGTPIAWLKVLADVPIVFVLASGGVSLLHHLRDRGFIDLLEGEVVSTDPDPGRDMLTQLHAQVQEMKAMLASGNVKIAGQVNIASPPPAPITVPAVLTANDLAPPT